MTGIGDVYAPGDGWRGSRGGMARVIRDGYATWRAARRDRDCALRRLAVKHRARTARSLRECADVEEFYGRAAAAERMRARAAGLS